MKISEKALKIINILENNGFSAYVVGGCVRDSLLGKEPYDWDICTDAKPIDIKNSFKNYKTIDTGIKHGTVTVVLDGENFEITTFRIDKNYINNRKPEEVEFTSLLKEDLARRDFTINAMAYNEKEGLIDYFNGQKHLKNKEIHTVGSASLRYNEDALRILRAIRFSSQLGFKICDEKSIYENKDLLLNISKERITQEFIKTILGDITAFVRFFPVFETVINDMTLNEKLKDSPIDLIIRLSLIFENNVDLKIEKKIIQKVQFFTKNNCPKTARINLSQDDFIKNISFLKLIGKNTSEYEKLVDAKVTSLKQLEISGNDLISFAPAEKIGEILNTLLFMLMDNEIENNKEVLILKAKTLL